jgi:hypothetical protein
MEISEMSNITITATAIASIVASTVAWPNFTAIKPKSLKHPTSDRSKRNPGRSDRTFIVWAVIFLIVLVVASIASGVRVDPSLSSFLSP